MAVDGKKLRMSSTGSADAPPEGQRSLTYCIVSALPMLVGTAIAVVICKQKLIA